MMLANGNVALFGFRDPVLKKMAERNAGPQEITT
jgi:ABC-type protease/lipase transport system fused ATPase/permease subunit